MSVIVGNLIGGSVDRLVRWVVVPVTGVIPLLVRTGLLFLLFAALWVMFLGALIVDPTALASAQREVAELPLVGQALAWLLFLPLLGGLWIWSTDWPAVIRVGLIVALAAWNLLVLIPRHEPSSAAVTN
ncbi:MAG TPA: hypothetical protein VFO73_09320 [Candidatus Limnocylindrales bacterium]|nr:hypothetical protein [Candidatus Limnocylindrales bacterium]